MEEETKIYFKRWGHYPFWDDPDPEGFNKRVYAEEVRLGMHGKNPKPYKDWKVNNER